MRGKIAEAGQRTQDAVEMTAPADASIDLCERDAAAIGQYRVEILATNETETLCNASKYIALSQFVDRVASSDLLDRSQ